VILLHFLGLQNKNKSITIKYFFIQPEPPSLPHRASIVKREFDFKKGDNHSMLGFFQGSELVRGGKGQLQHDEILRLLDDIFYRSLFFENSHINI